ncbi:MAG: formylglycine-generating enzyme family protein [Brevundimonas sp.]|uniref:formylglycine-generating enzyme family protein n=1 Tax=Brevundimonas sp. TaxID=1871086 RepID=UPI0027331D8B|nr:formylglycine-generating enzyme family protein [Brevundimonas sp.]MDP3404133.1 formylglycine-generating enzyme family protein [Brevundimonas sp.]
MTRAGPGISLAAVVALAGLGGCTTPPPVTPAVCPATPTTDGPGAMVSVPAGAFLMGDDVYADEGPRRQETVAAFRIDATEVTNAQFARFVAETGYVTVAEQPVDPALYPGLPAGAVQPGSAVFRFDDGRFDPRNAATWWVFVPGASWRHPEGPGSDLKGRDFLPVIHIALADAQAYARWAGRRLPTEIEWEWAARSADPDAGNPDRQPTEANTWQGVFPVLDEGGDGYKGAAPAGCFTANGLGVHDMIGNVWEWTADPYRPDRPTGFASGDPGADPRQPGVPVGVIKGGSYLCAPNYCMRYRPGARQAQDLTLGASHVGFRTVATEPEAPAAPSG